MAKATRAHHQAQQAQKLRKSFEGRLPNSRQANLSIIRTDGRTDIATQPSQETPASTDQHTVSKTWAWTQKTPPALGHSLKVSIAFFCYIYLLKLYFFSGQCRSITFGRWATPISGNNAFQANSFAVPNPAIDSKVLREYWNVCWQTGGIYVTQVPLPKTSIRLATAEQNWQILAGWWVSTHITNAHSVSTFFGNVGNDTLPRLDSQDENGWSTVSGTCRMLGRHASRLGLTIVVVSRIFEQQKWSFSSLRVSRSDNQKKKLPEKLCIGHSLSGLTSEEHTRLPHVRGTDLAHMNPAEM